MPVPPNGQSDRLSYFIRDDDVGPLTDGLRRFVETFASCAIPVSYQIIPAQFTSECADYLLAARRAAPGLIEFGQHGLNHRMRIGRRELNREFGPERTYGQQLDDIQAGFEILRARLGAEPPIEVFTPPQHKFNRDTLLAAAMVGHRTFSAAFYPTLHHQLAYDLGRQLDVSSYRHHGVSHHRRLRPEADMVELSIGLAVDDGRARRIGPEQIQQALARAGRLSPVVGAMFHHDVYEAGDGPAALAALAARLSAAPGGRFDLLGQLGRALR